VLDQAPPALLWLYFATWCRDLAFEACGIQDQHAVLTAVPDGGMESADDEDAVEREVMRDRNAPRFGEQALEPLKARLASWRSDMACFLPLSGKRLIHLPCTVAQSAWAMVDSAISAIYGGGDAIGSITSTPALRRFRAD